MWYAPSRRRPRPAAIRWLLPALLFITQTILAAAAGTDRLLAQTPRPQTTESSEDAFVPNEKPTLVVSRAPGPIALDGELDDPGWVGAARADNFSENWPRERAQPPVESEVWVTYDQESLYLAFIAYDDPGTIRASLRDRDEMWSDDYFGILLDTYGDASWAYFLFANPLGVQGDSRFSSNGGEDDGFDIIFFSEAKITDHGYQIEMAIPFKSLRFPNRETQSWRATFWRTRPRASRAQHTWAAINRDDPCFLCQFGTLTGINDVKPGGALELLPAVIANQSGELRDSDDPTSGLHNSGLDGEVALSVRYPFSSGLTAEATLNPDFSQVESDVAQIDVNRTFALFFPERRPFFLEGSDLFDTYFDVLYTRQINDPQVAGKFIGRLGRASFAYLGAVDENSPLILPFEEQSFVGQAGTSITNVARVRQTFLRQSYVGAIATDRRMQHSGGSGSTAGIDGRLRFLEKYSFEFQALASHTQEPDDPSLTEDVNGLTFDRGKHTAAFDGESFWGHAMYASLERDARVWSFDFDYWASSPTFRADNGFEFRNDFRRVSMWQGLFFYMDTKLLDRILPNVYMQRSWNFDGVRKNDFIAPSLEFSLKGDSYIDIEYQWERERFGGIDFVDLRSVFFFARTNALEFIRPGFWVSHGWQVARFTDPPVRGKGTNAEAWFTLKPQTRVVIEPSLQYSQLSDPSGNELFEGFILRTRTAFQFNRELFLRLIVQYNNFSEGLSIEPLLTYKINPFTLFYIGSTHGFLDYDNPDDFAQTSRQFFAKFQYLFRR